jgi:hypothetical protein
LSKIKGGNCTFTLLPFAHDENKRGKLNVYVRKMTNAFTPSSNYNKHKRNLKKKPLLFFQSNPKITSRVLPTSQNAAYLVPKLHLDPFPHNKMLSLSQLKHMLAAFLTEG